MIHHMLQRGKKSTAVNVMYDTLEIVRERSGGKDPVEIFDTAMRNVAPAMEVKPRRVGGATYQVPMEVAPVRRTTLAIRWVLDSARARAGKSFAEKLADELMDAYKNEGASIRKREETHKMAEANRAFSHYRM
jgi:small subunit ribosomal protein S7